MAVWIQPPFKYSIAHICLYFICSACTIKYLVQEYVSFHLCRISWEDEWRGSNNTLATRCRLPKHHLFSAKLFSLAGRLAYLGGNIDVTRRGFIQKVHRIGFGLIIFGYQCKETHSDSGQCWQRRWKRLYI
jgi:hypothetical protein